MPFSQLPYRQMTVNDREALQQVFRQNNDPMAIYGWQNIIMYVGNRFAFYQDCLMNEPFLLGNELWLMYPIGPAKKRKALVQQMHQYASKLGVSLVFSPVTPMALQELQEAFGSLVTCREVRDNACYLLSTQEQIAMEGGRFADQRRKLRRFAETYNWTYIQLTKDDLHKLNPLLHQWHEGHANGGQTLEFEIEMLNCAFENFEVFDMKGAMLQIDDKPVAFCIGFPTNDRVYQMPFHKSLIEYRDAMLFLLHEFFVHNCGEYDLINDNCDLGIEGLRQFKTKLRPVQMLDVYDVSIAPVPPSLLKRALRKARRIFAALGKRKPSPKETTEE